MPLPLSRRLLLGGAAATPLGMTEAEPGAAAAVAASRQGRLPPYLPSTARFTR